MGEKRLITAEDLANITHLDDPQFSPDGQWVAYVQQIPNLKDNTYVSNIWLVSIHDKQPIQLTRGQKDSQPRWSPDGKTLAFTSSRQGIPQIFLLPMFSTGGEARQLTTHINGANTPAWSKDGVYLAYLSRMNAQERAHEDQNALKASYADEKKAYSDPLVITRIPYRDGTSYHDDRFAQIYVVNVVAGTPRRITNQDAHYSQPEWSPNGEKLYTTRIVQIGGDEYWRRANIFEIDLISGVEVALLDGIHTVYDVLVAPNGKYITFNRRNSDDTASQFEFTLFDLERETLTVLNDMLDRPFAPYRWLDDENLIVVVASEGKNPVYRLNIDGTYTPIISDDQQIVGIDVAKNGTMVVSIATAQNPSELVYYDTNQAIALTSVNRAFLDTVQVPATHEIRFQSPYGEIQGWYVLPANYEQGKQYPLVVNIHGGPQLMWTSHERTMFHKWQFYAAQGYVVFYCNPRGSEGYGNAFNHALQHNWGELAMQDIMAGVDAMLSLGIVDAQRMVLIGGSFGGFMVAWITAHTHRFKVAVAQRGVFNLVSFYGTTDIPTFGETQFNILPWQNQAELWQKSPLAHAENIQTPFLIIHSENDFRAPIEQGEQLFAWLHRMGKKVKMVRFPREGHELTRGGEPTHRVRNLQEITQWWAQFLS
jgi:dipeptidyl aminopeptidase/acylaminoacyl peptidase